MAMTYRTLGRTGLRVSCTGLGTLSFMRADSSQEDVDAMIQRAREGGMNILDTAYAYGQGKTDSMVGKAIEKDRDRWVLITRSHRRDPDEFAESLEATYQNLRTNVLDIFQFHDVTKQDDYEALKEPGSIYDQAVREKEAGRMRFLGISTHGPAEMVADMIKSGRFDVITLGYNVLNCKRQHADGEDLARTGEEILPLAAEHNVGITVMKPFGGGALTTPRYTSEGRKVELPPLQLLKYCVANPHVASVTPGVESVAQVDDAISAGQDDAVLAEEELEDLQNRASEFGTDFCRRCGYCLPCPQEIVIPKAMQVLERFKTGDPEGGKKAYGKLDPKPDACTACGVCEDRCPYSLSISDKMKELCGLAA